MLISNVGRVTGIIFITYAQDSKKGKSNIYRKPEDLNRLV
jgi:hypothetical protein